MEEIRDKYLNNRRFPNYRSIERKKLIKNVMLKVKGDETNTNIFNPDTHYLDQVGNIRNRRNKQTLYYANQIELITGSDDPLEVQNPIVLDPTSNVNPLIANIQMRNEQTLLRQESRMQGDGIDPTGLRETIKERCGEKGEMLVDKLCEIAFQKKSRGKGKEKASKYTPKDEIEALKMLVFYFAGKPQEISTINKNVTQNVEKKVASFYRAIQGGKD